MNRRTTRLLEDFTSGDSARFKQAKRLWYKLGDKGRKEFRQALSEYLDAKKEAENSEGN